MTTPLTDVQRHEIAILRAETIRWARLAFTSPTYHYHLARGGSEDPVDRWIRMVVKCVLAGDGRDLLNANVWAAVKSHLAIDWPEFRAETRDAQVQQAWVTPVADWRLMDLTADWKPTDYPRDGTYPVPDHTAVTELQVDQAVLGA